MKRSDRTLACLLALSAQLSACDDQQTSPMMAGEAAGAVMIGGQSPAGSGGAGLMAGVAAGAEAGASPSAGARAGGAEAGAEAGAALSGGAVAVAGAEGGVEGGAEGGAEASGGAEGSMGGAEPCEFSPPAGEQRVAISYPFSEEIGVDGEAVQLYRATADELEPWGERVILGFRPAALSFSRDGGWLIALGERGGLATIDLRAAEPTLHERFDLPSGSFRSIARHPSEPRFDIPDGNSTEDGGLYTLALSCTGELELDLPHYPLRLTYTLQRSAEQPEWAIVVGGQARFDPIDEVDLRLFQERGAAWHEVLGLDLFSDLVDTKGVAFSASGRWIGVANGSPFSAEGGQTRLLSVSLDPPALNEVARFEGLADARRARFTPLEDRLVITQLEPGLIQLIDQREGGWALGEQLSGLGVADDFAMSAPPPWASEAEGREVEGAVWLWAPFTSPSGGSWLARIALTPGVPALRLSDISLGSGFSSIPGAVDVWGANLPK